MYGYGSWSSGKKKKNKVWTSTSGWERSHFGGYNRLVFDYPYITMDWNAKIDVPNEFRKNEGIFVAEKLIKIYLMKVKEGGYVGYLSREVVKKKNIIGREQNFQSIKLDNIGVFNAIISDFKEFSPLFVHYKDYILESSIMIEDPEQQQQKGGGSSQDGEGQDGEGQKGEGNGQDGEDQKGEGNGQDGEGNGQDGEDQKGEGEDQEGKNGKSEKESKDGKKSSGGWGGVDKPVNFDKINKILDEMKEQKPFSSWSSMGEGKPKFHPSDPKRYSTPYEFTRQEKINADLLVKLLDISFEPKSDVVKNLKLGNLDTSKIAEVPAGNISVYKQTLEDQDTKPFGVCILADMSGSMEGQRLDTQFKVLNSLYLALSEILPETDLYIYGHTGGSIEPDVYTFFDPYNTEYPKNIKRYYDISNSSNYDGTVIEAVHKKIRANTDNPMILVSISDGQPCDSVENMKKILERARRDQFVTVGIGIDTDYVKELYQYSKSVYNHRLDEMPKEVSWIINHVVKSEFQ